MSAEVTAKLKMDTAGFRRELARAQGQMKSFGTSMGTGLVQTTKLFSAALLTAGTAATASFGAMLTRGVALNSEIEQAVAQFTAFTKSASLAKEIVADLRDEAVKTPFEFSDMLVGGKGLIASAKGSREELMKLIKVAEILVALNPAQGFEGAAFALRNAVGGDFKSVQTRFDLPLLSIRKYKKEGKEGIEVINSVLKEMGAGPELIERMADTFEARKSKVKDFFDVLQQEASAPLFAELQESLMDFGGELESNETRLKQFAKDIGAEFGNAAANIDEYIKRTGAARDAGDLVRSGAKGVSNVTEFAAFTGTQIGNFLGLVRDYGDKYLTAPLSRLDAKGHEVIAKYLHNQDLEKDGYKGPAELQLLDKMGIFPDKNRKAASQRWQTAADKLNERARTMEEGAERRFRERMINEGLQQSAERDAMRGMGKPSQEELRANWMRAQENKKMPKDVTIRLQERNPAHSVMAT